MTTRNLSIGLHLTFQKILLLTMFCFCGTFGMAQGNGLDVGGDDNSDLGLDNHFTSSMGMDDRGDIIANCLAINGYTNPSSLSYDARINLNFQIPTWVAGPQITLSSFYVGATIHIAQKGVSLGDHPSRQDLNDWFPFSNTSTYYFVNQPLNNFELDPDNSNINYNSYHAARTIDITGFSNLVENFFNNIPTCMHEGRRYYVEFKIYRKVRAGRTFKYVIHDFTDIEILYAPTLPGTPSTFSLVNQADLVSNNDNLRDWDILELVKMLGGACGPCSTYNQNSAQNTINGGARSANSISASSTKVYPNPVDNFFNLQFNMETQSPLNINIYNAFGERMNVNIENTNYQKGANTLPIDASHLPSGMYIIELKIDNQSTQTLKFIKS